MVTSYNGEVLRVNLTERTINTEPLDMEKAVKYIGGRGLGTRMLLDEGCAAVEPLSPENKLIYITGPMTGTAVPTGGRYMVVTKSPLTGMIACSNSGGVWGAILKYAGWDAIVVEGKADAPVYLEINDHEVTLHDASDLWGKKSLETESILKERHTGYSVLNIGPAGENQALLAAIMNDGDRAAGRSGVGAVMGSKNLKAIVVKASKTQIDPHDVDALRTAAVDCIKKLRANGVTGEGLPTFGTAVLVNIINNIGAMPTKNWQESYYPEADSFSGETMKDTSLVKNHACHRCPIGCGRVVKLQDGNVVGGPEYEPLWAYGANCGNSDLDSINKANEVCNEMGLDAISTPCTIAAAMELYEKGLITDEDCNGVPLKWGSKEAIVTWTEWMGLGSNPLAKLMADGSYRLCQHYGVPELSMSVKKQEIPAYDARAIQGIGITYATSNRGGCHVRGYMISPEVLGLPEQLDRETVEGKAQWAKIFQDLTSVIDSMGMCLFSSFALGAPEYAALLNAGTGTNYDVNGLLEVGDRIYNLERMFNKAAGMKPEDDRLPKRIAEDEIVNGPSKGMHSQIKLTLPQYYEARGWKDAFPTEETLKRLGLEDLI
ncbi:MAG: aldehyde ferredoxin oxidoreductase family protein [Peptococcaceae bacterium]